MTITRGNYLESVLLTPRLMPGVEELKVESLMVLGPGHGIS